MDMFESLLTSSSNTQVDPEVLEMLGRKASEMFHNGTPLNDAIVKLASEHPNLGNEHIRRIAEFANNVTFQNLFQKSADKHVHFNVADPSVIIRDLQDGGSPAHDGKTLRNTADYATAPKSDNKNDMSELEAMFAPGSSSTEAGQEKTAGIKDWDHSGHINPIDDVWDTQLRLEGVRSELASAHEQMDLLLKTAKDEFYKAVKDEVVHPDGAGLGGVMKALEKIADSDIVASALTPIVEKLARDNVRTQDQLHTSLEKRAGVVVNPNHPLIQTWSGLLKVAQDKVAAMEALSEVDKALSQTRAFIKSSAEGRPVTQGIKSLLKPRLIPAALRERASRTR